MKLPQAYTIKKYRDAASGGTRLDICVGEKNIAYALVYQKSSIKRKEIAVKEKPQFQKIDGPWFEGLVVDPKYQKKGLGYYLAKKIEQYSKGQTIRLLAEPYGNKTLSAEELVEYYERLGYIAYDGNRMYKKVSKIKHSNLSTLNLSRNKN